MNCRASCCPLALILRNALALDIAGDQVFVEADGERQRVLDGIPLGGLLGAVDLEIGQAGSLREGARGTIGEGEFQPGLTEAEDFVHAVGAAELGVEAAVEEFFGLLERQRRLHADEQFAAGFEPRGFESDLHPHSGANERPLAIFRLDDDIQQLVDVLLGARSRRRGRHDRSGEPAGRGGRVRRPTGGQSGGRVPRRLRRDGCPEQTQRRTGGHTTR